MKVVSVMAGSGCPSIVTLPICQSRLAPDGSTTCDGAPFFQV